MNRTAQTHKYIAKKEKRPRLPSARLPSASECLIVTSQELRMAAPGHPIQDPVKGESVQAIRSESVSHSPEAFSGSYSHRGLRGHRHRAVTEWAVAVTLAGLPEGVSKFWRRR